MTTSKTLNCPELSQKYTEFVATMNIEKKIKKLQELKKTKNLKYFNEAKNLETANLKTKPYSRTEEN